MSDLTTGGRWALAGLAGVLNGIGFVFWGPAVLVANVPLLVALDGARSRRLTAGLGGLVGVVGGVHIYGILDYGALLFVGFSFYTGSQMVLFALLWRWLDGRRGPVFDVLLPALLWTMTEWLRTVGPLAMPASYVGCVADAEALSPWLALSATTGGLGVSTLVALIQSALFHVVFRWSTHRRPALIALALVGLAGLPGALSSPPPAQPLTVAAVQGGLANPQYKAAMADALARRDIVRTYETLTQQAYAAGDRLVVWPETAIRSNVLDTPALRARLFPPRDSASVLVAGLLHREPDGGRAWNLAVAAARGEAIGRYAKVRTVPRTEDYLTRGTSRAPLQTPAGALGVLICLESVYPDAGRETVAAGAELLLVLSNDAGFGTSPITRHMTNRARVRAVETGRWLVRVGQAGISAIIDPRGRIVDQLGLFEPGLLRGTVGLRRDRTLYVRWGDWWMGLCAGLLLAGIIRRRGSDAG